MAEKGPFDRPVVLVCGGRNYSDENRLYSELDRLHALHGLRTVVHGGALGADSLAGQWADFRHIPKIVVMADWDKHGKAAGCLRNQRMLDEFSPDLVVAFEGGRGTADMIRRSKAAFVPVLEIGRPSKDQLELLPDLISKKAVQ